jgi:pantothenate synthetase
VEALDAADRATAKGERGRDALLAEVRGRLGQARRAAIDYAELRNPDTLELAPAALAGPTLLALAVEFEADLDGAGSPVRLIDNRVLLAAPS